MAVKGAKMVPTLTSHSRARKRLSATLTPEQRIEVCLELMRDESFRTGKTVKVLARKYGESEHSWRRAAAAASVLRRREMPDHEVRERLEARLDEIAHQDEMDRVSACKLILDARGLLGSKRQPDGVINYDLGKLFELLRALGYEVTEKGKGE